MKIVINKCYGGFGLSYEAIMKYADLKGFKLYRFDPKYDKKTKTTTFYPSNKGLNYFKVPNPNEVLENLSGREFSEKWEEINFEDRDIPRDDLDLILIINEMGAKANGEYAQLEVVEIPHNVKWFIEEYDGNEWVAEVHRTWG